MVEIAPLRHIARGGWKMRRFDFGSFSRGLMGRGSVTIGPVDAEDPKTRGSIAVERLWLKGRRLGLKYRRSLRLKSRSLKLRILLNIFIFFLLYFLLFWSR